MEYKDFNDFELISYIAEGNEEANEILINKYQPLIKSLAGKMIQWCDGTGLEIGDLIQEGLLGLTIAIETYRDNKQASFSTHAKICVERKMLDLVKKSRTLKNKILNDSISIDEEESGLANFVLKDNYQNPEEIIVALDTEEHLITQIKHQLTEKEDQVFQLMLAHFNYHEIANILDCDPKSVDNTIQRIRAKVRKELKKHQ